MKKSKEVSITPPGSGIRRRNLLKGAFALALLGPALALEADSCAPENSKPVTEVQRLVDGTLRQIYTPLVLQVVSYNDGDIPSNLVAGALEAGEAGVQKVINAYGGVDNHPFLNANISHGDAANLAGVGVSEGWKSDRIESTFTTAYTEYTTVSDPAFGGSLSSAFAPSLETMAIGMIGLNDVYGDQAAVEAALKHLAVFEVEYADTFGSKLIYDAPIPLALAMKIQEGTSLQQVIDSAKTFGESPENSAYLALAAQLMSENHLATQKVASVYEHLSIYLGIDTQPSLILALAASVAGNVNAVTDMYNYTVGYHSSEINYSPTSTQAARIVLATIVHEAEKKGTLSHSVAAALNMMPIFILQILTL